MDDCRLRHRAFQGVSPKLRAEGGDLYGIQAWVALPTLYEQTAPNFAHHGAQIANVEADSVCMTLIAGTLDGLRSPVKVHADIILTNGGTYRIRADFEGQAIYILAGYLDVAGQSGSFGEGELVVLKPGAEIVIIARRKLGAADANGRRSVPREPAYMLEFRMLNVRPDRAKQTGLAVTTLPRSAWGARLYPTTRRRSLGRLKTFVGDF